MKRIFNLPLWRAGAFVAFALATVLGSTAANAAPNNYTPAGTTISNQATVTFSVGGVSQSPVGSSLGGNNNGAGSPTSFVVDNLVSHTVTTSDTAPVGGVPGAGVVAGTQSVTATFVVSNTGNNTQDYFLSVNHVATANNVPVYGGTQNDKFDA